MFSQAIKASELIEQLKALIAKHGDLGVYAGGGDYPEGVSGAWYVEPLKGDSYTPGNSFKVG